MVYSKKFVIAVKVGGKVLRESSDRVVLPFGSEYSILLKNLDSVRVQARVHIDGQDATDGTWLVIEPNSSLELERFIRNGNFDKGNRFKFIERTCPIEDARGRKIDDGLVRIEYKKEFVAPTVTENIVRTNYIYDHGYWYWPRPYVYPYRYPYWNEPYYTCNNVSQSSSTYSGALMKSAAPTRSSGTIHAMNCSVQNVNDAGITVPGSESQQKFTSAQNFQTESKSEVLILHLVGTNEKSQPVKKAVTVSDKPKCVTCHRVNKGGSKFCGQCGTALELI
jgi:hypothetical protein